MKFVTALAKSTAGFTVLGYSLPLLLKHWVNAALRHLPGYEASVESARFHFLSGRVELTNVVLHKKITREWKAPFITIPKLSLSLSWKHLLVKEIVGPVEIEDLEVVIDMHHWKSLGPQWPNPDRRKDSPSSWRHKVKNAMAFHIPTLSVKRGTVTLLNLAEQETLTLENLAVEIQNITNDQALADVPMTAEAACRVLSDGDLRWHGQGHWLQTLPPFKMDLQLQGIPLVKLQKSFRQYFNIDITGGTLDLLAEAQAQDGIIKGYVKPQFDHLQIQSTRKPTLWLRLKMVVTRWVVKALRNENSGRVMTRINFEGSLAHPHIDLIAIAGNFIRNAFGSVLNTHINPPQHPWLGLLKKSFSRWLEHEVPQKAAALSYYTCFSLAPLLLFIIAFVGLIFGREAAQGQILRQLSGLVGEQSAQTVQTMIAAAWQPSKGIMAVVVSIGTLLAGAFGVLSELKTGLNQVMQASEPGSLSDIVVDRAKYLGFILGIGFLLIVSLAVSTAMSAFSQQLANILPFPEFIPRAVELALSVGVITVVFTLIFRFLPNRRLSWHALWVGGCFTAVLFTLGKSCLGIYLGRSSTASSYGAAGSVLIVLLWVYYSALLLYYGAEFTKVYSEYSRE